MQRGRVQFGAGMAPPHVRQRIASLPPEARAKAIEAMKRRWQELGAKADAIKAKGREALREKSREELKRDAESRREKPKEKEEK